MFRHQNVGRLEVAMCHDSVVHLRNKSRELQEEGTFIEHSMSTMLRRPQKAIERPTSFKPHYQPDADFVATAEITFEMRG